MVPPLTIPITVLCLLIAAAAARRAGLVDHPDERKQHKGQVPLCGGVAILASVAVFYSLGEIQPYTPNLLPLTAVVLSMGLIDDWRHIRPGWRLVLEYLFGIALVTYAGIAISNVGNLLGMGDIPLLIMTIPLTALSVAGLCNAYNMIDGIDGLAATTLMLPLAVLWWLSSQAGSAHADFTGSLVLMLAVFLCFNLGPDWKWWPRIFLGDAGSITIGFLVTASLVFYSQGENTVIAPVTALWLVTVPLMDMLATMLLRVRAGHSPMQADRRHLHHRLLDMGFSSRATLCLLVAYGVVCAAVGLLLEALPAYLSLLLYFVLFLAHCYWVTQPIRPQRSKPARHAIDSERR